jgi:sigma-E factor negative regulatory protein RseA
MNDALRMQISVYIDGELPENESQMLLRRLSQDPSLRQQVADYLAIGRMIRRDSQVRGMNEFRGRIAAALGEELQQQPETGQVSASRFARPLAGLAVAASVTVLALFGLRQMDADGTDGQTYTQPQSSEVVVDSRLLDTMFRHHADSSDAASVDNLARFITMELSEEGLVQTDPVSRPVSEDKQADDDKTDDEAVDAAGTQRVQ